jgi:dienelactone hydrolase
MGYCFGGTVTLALARSGAAEDVAGWASFHGNFPDGPDWPEETAPILVMHGGIDQNPSMSDLADFVEEAEAAGLEYDVEIYAGADHAFSVFGGRNYQERADTRSWETFDRFLEAKLGAGES